MVPWSGTCKEGGTPRARQLAADGQKLAEPAATMREKEREIVGIHTREHTLVYRLTYV